MNEGEKPLRKKMGLAGGSTRCWVKYRSTARLIA